MDDPNTTITGVPGIRVGHASDPDGLTGCTVVLCDAGTVGGVDQRGGAPGTRETDLLRPLHLVETVNGVVLSGGSAFGLAAADGVVDYLESQGVGFDAGVARVPIVPAAVLFDLDLGDARARPDAAMGRAACRNASKAPTPEGNVGAGTGASVGRILGPSQAMKAGLGSACIALRDDLMVGAIVAVNAFGDVVDPDEGRIIAGARHPEHDWPADTLHLMCQLAGGETSAFPSNTIIGVVACNARLSKEQTNKVAQMAQDGIARVVRPAHTMVDGDTLFALATGGPTGDVNLIGAYAAEAVAQAIVRGVKAAVSAGGAPAWRDVAVEW